jgi:hypothetical protein
LVIWDDSTESCRFCENNTRAQSATECGPDPCDYETSVTNSNGECEVCAKCTIPDPLEISELIPGMKT